MILAPLAGSVTAMAILSRALPTPRSGSAIFLRLAWWGAILAGSLAAMWLVDWVAKRLAPLAALCDMAVLFPGRAPSRLVVARRAGDVRLLRSLVKAPATSDDAAVAPSQASTPTDAAARILALVGALRAHDRHTRGHSERVRVYADLIAAEMRLPAAAIDRLRWAALLHDIGKLAIPASTLNKPAKLSRAEWEVMRRHPAEGARLAQALLPWLGEWGLAIAEHHERWDGTGYPSGLSGRDISISGRIVAVADAFEVMTAPRAYKRAMTRQAALEELVRSSGTQFDPDVVRVLLRVSAPKLRWAMGPTSWLVGTPFLGAAPSLTGAGVAAQAAVGVTSVAVAGVTGLAAPLAAPASVPSTPAAPSATTAPSPHASHPSGRPSSPRSPSAQTAPTPPQSLPASPSADGSARPTNIQAGKPSTPGHANPPASANNPPANATPPGQSSTPPGNGKGSAQGSVATTANASPTPAGGNSGSASGNGGSGHRGPG